MKDKGLDMGLIETRDTSKREQRGWSKGFFGFRKMFWDYLNKLHVGFFDPCCPEANGDGTGVTGLRFNNATGDTEFWDPYTETWIAVDSWAPTTTTTTTTVP